MCYTRAEFAEAMNKETIKEFSMKADAVVENLEKKYYDGSGREVMVVERIKDPGDAGGQVLTDDNDYDFGAPNEQFAP